MTRVWESKAKHQLPKKRAERLLMIFPQEHRKPTPGRAFRKARGISPLSLILFLAIGLALLGTLAYYFLDQLTELEQEAARLGDQVQSVAERAEAAHRRAAQAEQNALQAARAKEQAEEAKAKSEKTAQQALEEMKAAKQEAGLARQEAERIRKQREAELNRLYIALNQIAKTRRTALGLVMNLGSDAINFDFDKANLRPEDRELLSRIVGVLLTSKGYRTDVYGHTDDIGTEEYNQKLSERRARTVRDYLVKAGIDPRIITAKGLGKSSPRVPGTDSKARATNRRVELAIIDSVIQFEGLAPTEEQ